MLSHDMRDTFLLQVQVPSEVSLLRVDGRGQPCWPLATMTPCRWASFPPMWTLPGVLPAPALVDVRCFHITHFTYMLHCLF